MVCQTDGMDAQGPIYIVVKVATLVIASCAIHGQALHIEHYLIHSLHWFATHLSKTCVLCAKHKPKMNNSVFSMQSDVEQYLKTVLDSVLSN